MNAEATFTYDRSFFMMATVDENHIPTDRLTVQAPVNVMVIRFPGAGEFAAAITDAVISGMAITVAEVAFQWGIAVIHLPQVWDEDDASEDDIKALIATAEDQLFAMTSNGAVM